MEEVRAIRDDIKGRVQALLNRWERLTRFHAFAGLDSYGTDAAR
jgi:hypothetical protein